METTPGIDPTPLVDRDDDALSRLFATPPGIRYLDAAAHGPRLESVHTAARAALERGVAPWRMSMDEWGASIERVRTLAAGFLDGDPDGMAMVPSVAHAMATAARNLPLRRGEAVLVRDREFPSNLLPWQQHCEERGARLVVAPTAGEGRSTDSVLQALDDDAGIRIVALSHAHWHDGALLDLDRIADAVHARGAHLVLDLSQSLGVLPVDIRRWRPDFVASVGHKWLLGSYGLAWMWVAPRWRDAGRPLAPHWTAHDPAAAMASPSRPPPYRAGARRFDAGGVAHGQHLAMADAALSQLSAWGQPAIRDALAARTAAFDAVLADAGLSHWSTRGHAPHFLGLRPDPARYDAVVAALDALGAVCTKRHGLLRIAPHLQVGVAAMREVAAAAVAARP